jgi:hypothetical protein
MIAKYQCSFMRLELVIADDDWIATPQLLHNVGQLKILNCDAPSDHENPTRL